MTRSILFSLSLAATLTACVDDNTRSFSSADDDPLAGMDANMVGAKVDVCHVKGNGSINIINVSTSAMAAHLAHGDHLAGTYYLDTDGDGFGDDGVTSDCLDPGFVINGGDCDDDDTSVYPAAPELCDGLDNDCDGSLSDDELDDDSDGVTECDGDCDDDDGTSYPGAAEICDGIDNDCDGYVPADEVDDDGDGQAECDGDCDDDNITTYLGAEEICDDGINNDCDTEIDEECTVEVEIQTGADNGVWAWVEGEPVVFNDNTPNWQLARNATLDLNSGQTYTFAFYVEDWGGLAYFVSSISVDGAVAVVTGDGDFATTGSVVTSVDEYPRIEDWDQTPTSAADSLNLLFSPGTTWGDWMLSGFDDSSWSSDTNLCTSPSTWNTVQHAVYYPSFSDLAADGAAFVFHDYGYWSSGTCYSPGFADNGSAYRVEITL